MLKHIVFLFFSLCLLAGCYNPHLSQLEEIESLLPHQRDSAVALFVHVDSATRFTQEEQTLYDLLQTRLSYWQGKSFASDSIIDTVVRYYENKTDYPRLLNAYYLQGHIAYQLRKIPKAQRCFLNALEVAEKMEQPNLMLLGRIYNRCGDLYAWNDAYEDALVMNRKSLDVFEQLSDTLSLSYVYRDIARDYELLQVIDSARYYYEQSNLLFSLSKDEEMYYDILLEYTGFLIEHDLSDSLTSFYLNKIKTMTSDLSDHACLMYGTYYARISEADSALYYLMKAGESENIYTKAASLAELFRIKKEQGDIETALNYLEMSVQLEDEIIDQSRTEFLIRSQAEYNYEKAERENLELKLDNYRTRIHLFQVGGVSVFLVVILFFLLKRKRQQMRQQQEYSRKIEREKQEVECLYRQTLLKITSNEKEIEHLTFLIDQEKQLSESVLQQMKKRIEYLQGEQQANKSTLNLLGNRIKESMIFLKFYQAGLGQSIEITDSDWLELQSLIETVYPDFLSRLFFNYIPSRKELRLCLLLKTGLSISAIAELLYCTVSSVSATRSRLYTKITGKKGSARNLDDHVSSL